MAERKIDGETYRVEPMPASKAIELYADLVRVATQGTGRLPAILLGLEAKQAGEFGAGELAETAALSAINDILSKNDSADIRGLVERVVTEAQIKNVSGYYPVNFDEQFTGRLGSILPVARFVLEVNFADFFPASAGSGLLSRLQTAFAPRK